MLKKTPPSINTIKVPAQFKILNENLTKKRDEYGTVLVDLSSKIQTVEELPVLQSDMLVLRHDLCDEIMKMQVQLYEIDYKIDVYKKKVLLFYKTESDFTLNNFTESNIVINADVSLLNTTKKILNEYIEYLKECRKTLDNMGFAIRNRIELLKTENI